MADKDEVDSTEASDATADPSGTDGPAPGDGPSEVSDPIDADESHDGSEPDGIVDHDDHDDPEPVEGDPADSGRELVTVGAPAKDQQAGADDHGATVARGRQKKNKATPRQKQAPDKNRRTGPVKFVKESISELQKVVYPTGNQLVNYFIVVLIFVLFIIAIVSVLDLLFGKAIIAVFG